MTKVMISGASSGFGRAIAHECAEAGYSLLLLARREELLRKVAEECTAKGAPNVQVLTCDVQQQSDTEAAGRAFAGMDGKPVLINNAGFADFGTVSEKSLDQILEQIDTNLLGKVRLTHAALPEIVNGSGHIINILSIVVDLSMPGTAAYAAAKTGAKKFFDVLRQEVRKEGVRITNLLPGAADTPVWDGANWKPKVEDMLTAEHIAKTVVWLIQTDPGMHPEQITVMPPKGLL